MTNKPLAEHSIAVLTMDCGCKIWQDGWCTTNYAIEYCPTHKAAPELVEALKAIRDSDENDLAEYAKFCEDTARQALVKAGKEV